MAARTDPDAHPFQPGPDRTAPDAAGKRWAACAVCAKSVRAHPRRSHAEVETAKRSEARAMRAAYRASLAPPETPGGPDAPGVPAIPVAAVLEAPQEVRPDPWQVTLLRVAVDRFLLWPEDRPDHPGWRVTARLREVQAILSDKPIPQSNLTPAVPHVPRPKAPDEPVTIGSRKHSAARILKGFRSADIRDIVKAALDQGFQCRITGTNHVRCEGLTGSFSVSTTSDGGGRITENIRADARRAGVVI